MRLEMSKETKGNWFITPAELENSPFLKAVDKPRYNIFFPQAYGLIFFFFIHCSSQRREEHILKSKQKSINYHKP